MSDNVSFRLVGDARLISSLDRASRDVGQLREAFDAVGNIVADASSSFTPVRTGALAGSITSQTLQSANSGGVDITSPLKYANPIHWGVPSHNIDASLFILRGVDASESAWSAAIDTNLQHICDNVEGA
jgi:hypothetical protein